VRQAIQDVTAAARGGLGVLALSAAGNNNGAVGFPSRLDASIAVGTSTNQGRCASYSCHGPELDLAAPSSGGLARQRYFLPVQEGNAAGYDGCWYCRRQYDTG